MRAFSRGCLEEARRANDTDLGLLLFTRKNTLMRKIAICSLKKLVKIKVDTDTIYFGTNIFYLQFI